jgi:cytochrome c oxidase subunit IV
MHDPKHPGPPTLADAPGIPVIHDAHDFQKHVRTYIGVFVALMVLTIVTVSVASLHLAVPLAVTVALFIAFIKGSLVASFFMHLISEKKAIYGALLLTVVFFLVLLFMPAWGHYQPVECAACH